MTREEAHALIMGVLSQPELKRRAKGFLLPLPHEATAFPLQLQDNIEHLMAAQILSLGWCAREAIRNRPFEPVIFLNDLIFPPVITHYLVRLTTIT